MKTLLISCLLLFIQNDSILSFFAKGNVEGIQSHLADDVIITLDGEMDFYTLDEAAEVLTSFFETNVPKSAKRIFDDERDMITSRLETSQGSFRLTITYEDGQITEITFLRN